ncbi:MAG: flagellar biosynthesis anti-sigma factor FlgM [Acidobacteria bacterium]|nr:flagellar biosynthesis anti-sigma factor FlgM [Acidobacteriota bacterium]
MQIQNGVLPETATLGTGEAAGAAQADRTGAPAAPRETAAGDRVAASRHQELVSLALQASGSERAARIQQLRLEVQAGQYAVDPNQVSRKLVEEALHEPPRS